MRIAILSAGDSWHVRDLLRVAKHAGHAAESIDFRRLTATVGMRDGPLLPGQLTGFDAVLVRTMPPGSLEQVVFRMELLHRLQHAGVRVVNPPRACEICIDK